MSAKQSVLRSRTLTQIVLACLLVQIAFAYPAAAQDPAPGHLRIAATYTPAVASGLDSPSTIYFASVHGEELMAGGDVTFKGVIQSAVQNASIPYESTIPADVIQSISFTPEPPLAPSAPGVYQILEDGQPTGWELRLATFVDHLKADTLIHSASVVNPQTGETLNIVALNDPVPVVVIIGGGLVLLLCGTNIVAELANSCAAKATKACAPNGVKSVKSKVTAWSLLSGCRSECTFECYPPKAQVVPSGH